MKYKKGDPMMHLTLKHYHKAIFELRLMLGAKYAKAVFSLVCQSPVLKGFLRPVLRRRQQGLSLLCLLPKPELSLLGLRILILSRAVCSHIQMTPTAFRFPNEIHH